MVIGKVQLGKNGVTENFILTLQNQFKKHKDVKVHVLKSARGSGKEGKQDMKKYANEILSKLGKNYTAKTIGFMIKLKKWRKDMRE